MFWGGSVAKDKEIPDFLSGGAADMGDIITPYFPDKFPLNNAVGYFIPQPHSTIEIAEMLEYWHRAYPQFDDELKRYNLKTIGFRPLENYGMICTKPVQVDRGFQGPPHPHLWFRLSGLRAGARRHAGVYELDRRLRGAAARHSRLLADRPVAGAWLEI